MRAFVSWLLVDPIDKAQLHEPQGTLMADWEGFHRSQQLRSIKGYIAHSFLDLQSKAETLSNCQQKRSHCMRELLKILQWVLLQSGGMFVVWIVLVTVWSCCTDSEYIYLCNVVCLLILKGICFNSWGMLTKWGLQGKHKSWHFLALQFVFSWQCECW